MEIPANTRSAVSKRIWFFGLTFGVLLLVGNQYPSATAAQSATVLDQRRQLLPIMDGLLLIMDGIAEKVVQKNQNPTGEKLGQKRDHGPSRLIARAMNRKPKDESAAGIDYPIAPRIPDPSKADPDDPTKSLNALTVLALRHRLRSAYSGTVDLMALLPVEREPALALTT